MALREIERLSDRHQAVIAARDRALLREMAVQYAYVHETLMEELARTTAKIVAARASGERVGVSWLFQEGRLQRIRLLVEAELGRYGKYADSRISAAQREAISLSMAHSVELMRLGVGGAPSGPGRGGSLTFASLPVAAIERMVGTTLHNGAPLAKTLNRYPREAARSIRRALVTAVALGKNPKQTARALERELGGTHSDYLRIARTEQLNAYRQSSLSTYALNSRVVEGWEWLLGRYDACEFCKSKTGKVYSLSTPFITHPMCRCAVVPKTKSWEEILAA